LRRHYLEVKSVITWCHCILIVPLGQVTSPLRPKSSEADDNDGTNDLDIGALRRILRLIIDIGLRLLAHVLDEEA